ERLEAGAGARRRGREARDLGAPLAGWHVALGDDQRRALEHAGAADRDAGHGRDAVEHRRVRPLAHAPPRPPLSLARPRWLGLARLLEQAAEGRHRLGGVRADRAHAQTRPPRGPEREQREHAAPAHPLVLRAAAGDLDVGREARGQRHEAAGGPRVQPELPAHREVALAGVVGHRFPSGRISLATRMLRCPYSLMNTASSSSGFFSVSVASLISIGRLRPVTTSTRCSPRNERLMLDGVPPNMSVSTSTPSPWSARRSAWAIASRISSTDCFGSIDTASTGGASGTISRRAWRNSSPSR